MPSGDKEFLLIVDDDLHSLGALKASLEELDHAIITCDCPIKAQEIIEKKGCNKLLCVVTDFNMPGLTGLQFFDWVKNKDETISTIVVSGAGDMVPLKESLKMGLYDYFNKPFHVNDLRKAVKEGVYLTKRRRKRNQASKGIKYIEEIHEKLSNQVVNWTESENPAFSLKSFFAPAREAGGDFINFHTLSEEELLIIVGDVSGHDMKSSFVASYFQGVASGMLKAKSKMEKIAEVCNEFLVEQWNTGKEELNSTMLSIAVSFLKINTKKRELVIQSHGCPLPFFYLNEKDEMKLMGSSSSPLGWFETLDVQKEVYAIPENGICYMWSDGLDDQASKMGISAITLAYMMLRVSVSREDAKAILGGQLDDIAIIEITWPKNRSGPLPIFHQRYAGHLHFRIDDYQMLWKNSLQLVFPDITKDRMNQILLCTREALLNALIHGCNASAHSYSTVQMSVSADCGTLYVCVYDQGSGFDFQKLRNLVEVDPESEHLSLGQVIIKNLASYYEYHNNGSSILLRFDGMKP